MTLTVVDKTGKFDPYTRDQASIQRIINLAAFGGGTAAERRTAKVALARSMGRRAADFRARATTTASESGQIIDLTDEGVTFPASKVRTIEFSSLAKSDNDQWRQSWAVDVWGDDGVTPKVVGDARLVHASGVINGTEVAYGRCHAQSTYSGDTATAVAANSSQGSSLGNNSTNTITLTHPIARTSPKWIAGVNASADVATVTEQLHVGGVTATSTTFTMFCADLATPSADGFDDAGTLDVDFYILPPPSVTLTVSTANVELHIGHNATDDLVHLVEVYCGPALDWTVSPT